MGPRYRAPRNPTRRQRSSTKTVQTWHYILRKPLTALNDINALRARGPVYCSSRVMARCFSRNSPIRQTSVRKVKEGGTIFKQGSLSVYLEVDYRGAPILSGKSAYSGLRFDGHVRTVLRIQFLHYTTHMDFDGAFAHTQVHRL